VGISVYQRSYSVSANMLFELALPTFDTTPCLKKQSKLFSSELRQISTNFDNFWHKDT